MTEAPETTDLTVQDILEEAGQSTYHAILEVWREVLKPAASERLKRITPQYANRICTTYNGMQYSDMLNFRDLYFDHILELARILDIEIDSDDECLNIVSAEEDVAQNSHHYINVLTEWQKAFLQWELNWDCADPDAGLQLAAISEVHRMFFDQNGLTALLDQIKFEFTDADRDALAEALAALRDEAGE